MPSLEINVGPLNGVTSFCLHTAGGLRKFNDLYRRGSDTSVSWDLRNVETGHLSMAGLTAFLATAYRLRAFVKTRPPVLVTWNPQVFGFLDDISFFRISNTLGIFEWPEQIVGGYDSGKTNPNTQLLVFPFDQVAVPRPQDADQCKAWKARVRPEINGDILLRCGHIFKSSRTVDIAYEVIEQIAMTCTELILNCLLWGRAPAFVGLQRTSPGITVAVCDSGSGFRNTLALTQARPLTNPPIDHLQAVVLGSLINVNEYGLRRAIHSVLSEEGWVAISSFDAEIVWRPRLWSRVKDEDIWTGSSFDVQRVMPLVPAPARKISREQRDEGFVRKLDLGLRGTRIAFEIPIKQSAHA